MGREQRGWKARVASSLYTPVCWRSGWPGPLIILGSETYTLLGLPPPLRGSVVVPALHTRENTGKGRA